MVLHKKGGIDIQALALQRVPEKKQRSGAAKSDRLPCLGSPESSRPEQLHRWWHNFCGLAIGLVRETIVASQCRGTGTLRRCNSFMSTVKRVRRIPIVVLHGLRPAFPYASRTFSLSMFHDILVALREHLARTPSQHGGATAQLGQYHLLVVLLLTGGGLRLLLLLLQVAPSRLDELRCCGVNGVAAAA
eukprot:gene11669-biopygen8462